LWLFHELTVVACRLSPRRVSLCFHLLELLLAFDLELVPRFEPRFFELPVPFANWNFSARLPLL
jgi:hypothetical protein